jgi:hypothetical protein
MQLYLGDLIAAKHSSRFVPIRNAINRMLTSSVRFFSEPNGYGQAIIGEIFKESVSNAINRPETAFP